MSFAAPAWLLGLLLVPLIWYLHRSGPILRSVPVSSLLLWRKSEAASLAAGVRPRPDPAWLWRAAAAVLLSIALAGPQLEQGFAPVTIWIDDSLSMQTMEEGRSRIDAALAQARSSLSPTRADTIVLRRLSRPWQVLSMNDATSIGAAAAGPAPPPQELLDVARAHWLVTDGTNAELNEWLRSAPIERVIQVGATARNVGITRVAARRELDARDRIAVEAVVSNGGNATERRSLSLEPGSATPISRTVELEAGSAGTFTFTLDALPESLRLQLEPADALAEDDAAVLDLGPLLPVRVAIDAGCAPGIARAVEAHPALRRTTTSTADLQLICTGTRPERPEIPTIWFASGPATAIAQQELTWTDGLEVAHQVEATALPQQVRGRLGPPQDGDLVMLAAGDEPLIVRRGTTPRLVETSLDLGSPLAGRQASLPLLVALLAEAALDRPLLGPLATLDRGSDASRVLAREKLSPSVDVRPQASTLTPLDIRPLIALALLLLAWDAWTLRRRYLRDRGKQWMPAT